MRKVYKIGGDAMYVGGNYPLDYEGGMSGRRGRGMNGRFVSREGASYADGYSEGYSEAMRQSGHYPMGPWPERMRY